MEARRGAYTPQVTDDLLNKMVRAIVAEVDPEQSYPVRLAGAGRRP